MKHRRNGGMRWRCCQRWWWWKRNRELNYHRRCAPSTTDGCETVFRFNLGSILLYYYYNADSSSRRVSSCSRVHIIAACLLLSRAYVSAYVLWYYTIVLYTACVFIVIGVKPTCATVPNANYFTRAMYIIRVQYW